MKQFLHRLMEMKNWERWAIAMTNIRERSERDKKMGNEVRNISRKTMTSRFVGRLASVVVAVLASTILIYPTVSVAQTGVINLRSGVTTAKVRVTKGKPQTVRTDRAFSEIVVGDPEIADVSPLTDNTFYILGGKIGTTGIALFDKNKALIGQMDIEVTYDTTELKRVLRAKLPNSRIKVSSANGRIVLSGSANDAPSAVHANDIAKQFGNEVISSVGISSSQQVQLEVRFIEAARNKNKDLGIRWSVAGSKFSTVVGATGLVSGGAPFGAILGRIISNGVSADALINALETRGLARRLAEPNLVALSGQKASFLAGGEFPIPVSQGANGNISVEFKKFGVGLEFTPTVLKDGIINLVVSPEVSEIDVSNTVKYGDIEIPSLTVRRATTTVQLRDGQSFVMAGLLQTSSEIRRRQFPWISDIPVLGALFRSVSFRRKETDLVIIVTPRLVKPIVPGKRIRTPLDDRVAGNDVDVFLRGKSERRPSNVHRVANSEGSTLPIGHIMELN